MNIRGGRRGSENSALNIAPTQRARRSDSPRDAADARIARGAWAAAALLCLTPAAAAGGALALAPLITLAGFVGAPFRSLPALARRGGWPLLMFALFLAWTLISSLWSPAPKTGVARLAAGAAGGLALIAALAHARARGRALVTAATAAALAMLTGLLLIEALFGMPLNRLAQPHEVEWALAHNPGTGVAVFLLLGSVGGLALVRLGLRWLAIGIGALTLYLVFQFDMNANVVAAPLAALVAALAYVRPRATVTTLGLMLAALMMFAPLLARALPSNPPLENQLPFSWDHRLEIWRSSAARIAQAPLVGHGFDASRAMDAPTTIHGESFIAIPLHPHNVNLQIWLETGAIGASLAAAALLLAARALGKRLAETPALAAALAGGATIYAVHANISYGMWQEWWFGSGFLFAALIAAQWPRATQTPAS